MHKKIRFPLLFHPTLNTQMCVCMLSLQPHGVQPASLLCPWDFPGKNTKVFLPCPFLGDLPDPGIEPTSLASPSLGGRFFITEPPWEAPYLNTHHILCFKLQNVVSWYLNMEYHFFPMTLGCQPLLSPYMSHSTLHLLPKTWDQIAAAAAAFLKDSSAQRRVMLFRFLFLLVKDKVQRDGDFWKCFSFLKCLNVKSSNTFLKRN